MSNRRKTKMTGTELRQVIEDWRQADEIMAIVGARPAEDDSNPDGGE